MDDRIFTREMGDWWLSKRVVIIFNEVMGFPVGSLYKCILSRNNLDPKVEKCVQRKVVKLPRPLPRLLHQH